MKPKETEGGSIMDMLNAAVGRLGEVVDERYWVVEIKPGKEDWYDGWSKGYPDEVVDKSEYFKTYEEAKAHMEKMTFERTGNRLELRHQKCYERLERRWM